MHEGLYEKLVSVEVLRQLEQLAPNLRHKLETADRADVPQLLSRHVAEALTRHLSSEHAVERINELLSNLEGEDSERLPEGDVQILTAVTDTSPQTHRPYDVRPVTPLSEAALLTNAGTEDEPSLGRELRAELASADRVDLLCAFVMWPGIRLLEDELRQLAAHKVPIRIITSTYTGCTDRRTLDRLINEFGAQVKVHYENSRTRLHAKAWLFRRNTGYDTGYVGSSNLSSSALLDGVEWNVRISSVATPTLMRKFDATFESYWNDPAFETYIPSRDAKRLDEALAKASGKASDDSITLSGLQVRPLPHQRIILDQLEVERVVHGRHKNLVVAATGTGKTVMAALDYQRLCQESVRPRILFLAHRKEILHQAKRTYAEVLQDSQFGEYFVGGNRPRHWNHVFASIQSFSQLDLSTVDPHAYDIIVIDEFHHAGAATYRKVLAHFQPRELLGLTATPERGDGFDVRTEYFDGHIAAELRLWDALAADLLTPFHYFAVGDVVDLRNVTWRGTYDSAELSTLYTGNNDHARTVLRAVRDKVGDVAGMKAIGFCASVAHAQFMTDFFDSQGVPSLTVTGQTADRDGAVEALKRGEVKVLFTVDVFNEGIDIPQINTVLFLRPTESPTIFLQQLGRGLRLANNKPVLTALDFVGHQRAEYRWDHKLRAVAKSMSRRELTASIKNGFDLPGGSQMVLDEVAAKIVLENVKNSVPKTWPQWARELSNSNVRSLQEFLDDTGGDLSDVLRNNKSWTTLQRDAGRPLPPSGPYETELVKRVRALAHVDDPERHAVYSKLLSDGMHLEELSTRERQFAQMLFFSLFPTGGRFTSIHEAFEALQDEPAVRAEMREVLDMALLQARVVTLPGTRLDLPLRVHARYTREELLAAIGWSSLENRRFPSHAVQGVYHVPTQHLDAFLVTTVKTDSGFSPNTMYRDYAISRNKFHWESQSTTRETSETGQRYVRHAERDHDILLFARQHKVWELGGGAPFTYLGTARYLTHTGERPMAVTWELDAPMPERVFGWASVM